MVSEAAYCGAWRPLPCTCPLLGLRTLLSCMHACRYALNVMQQLLNKSIFKYFPYPWTVSTVHVLVGLVYCIVLYAVGLKDASFGRVGGAASSQGLHRALTACRKRCHCLMPGLCPAVVAVKVHCTP